VSPRAVEKHTKMNDFWIRKISICIPTSQLIKTKNILIVSQWPSNYWARIFIKYSIVPWPVLVNLGQIIQMQELSAKNLYRHPIEKIILVCKISDFVSLQFIQYYTIQYNMKVACSQ